MSDATVCAPAKVNLSLAVLDRRPDGFHEVDTVLVALDWCDRVTLAAGPGDPVEVRGPLASPDVPRDASNLAHRAAAGVAALAGAPAPRLVLEKHVPSRAGLGGGSSDAAAAALLAARLHGLDPDDPRVLAVLDELGSDCAFFLAARATGLARCGGRGERVAPLAAALDGWFVVSTPAVECPTPEVWRALRPEDWSRSSAPFDPVTCVVGPNDLERAATRVRPELGRWRALLDELGEGRQRLAGSGSSFFGYYESEAAAHSAAERVAIVGKARNLGLRAQRVVRARGAGVGP